MRALLRAERIRYRRRIELWLTLGAVVVFGVVGFLAGYRTDANEPPWPTPEQVRADVVASVDFSGMSEEQIEVEIDRMTAEWLASMEQEKRNYEEQQAVALQKYDVAQSPFTMLGTGILPMVALVFVATLLLGDEFRYGTVRTSLLAATNRRRFLVARLVTFLVLIVGLFAALVLAAALLAVLLRLVGAGIPPMTEPLDAAAGVALLAAQLLVAFTLVALAVALTVLTRSGALPLLLLLVWALAELFILNLQIFQPGAPLAPAAQLFLTTNIRNLLDTLALQSGAIAYAISGVTPQAAAPPIWAMVAIIAAWMFLFLAIADRRFRTMDIVE